MTFMLGACTLLLVSAQDGAVDLKWKFRPEQELRYEVTRTTKIQVQGIQQVQETETTYLWSVKHVAQNGDATIQMKYESLRIKVSGMQEYEYDSRKRR